MIQNSPSKNVDELKLLNDGIMYKELLFDSEYFFFLLIKLKLH